MDYSGCRIGETAKKKAGEVASGASVRRFPANSRERQVLVPAAAGRPREQKRLYSVKDAAEYLGRTVPAMRELLYKGYVPYVQLERAGKQYIDVRDMDAFIEAHKTREKTGD